MLVGLGIMFNAGEHLWGTQPIPKPNTITLWIAVLTAVINEALFQITLRISKKIKSDILEVNAWHARSDAWVSLVVIIGIIGALLGFKNLDALGAAIVGILIIKLGGELGWKSISELVDTGVDEKTLDKLRKIITTVPGVCTLHMLRTRTIKNNILVDVHILVSPHISVSEGHFIGDQVIIALKKLPEVSDTTVHVDPEDDEISHPSSQLSTRNTIEALLKKHLQNLTYANEIRDIRLHYLNGKLEIEIMIPFHPLDGHDLINLTQQYKKMIKTGLGIDQVNIYFFHA